jgi:MFS family permease
VADLISTVGTEMTAIALPWFVLVTTGSPARMGLVLAAEFVGLAVLGLIGARVATVVGPRRLMLAADLSRAALIGAIPLLSWWGWLSFPVILLIGFVVGGFFPAYQSSSQVIVAGLVSDDELRMTRFGGLQGAFNEFASFVGPALGGVLVAAFGPSPVLFGDAVTYVCAFALVGLLVRPASHAMPAGQLPVDQQDVAIRAGLRYLWRNRPLRKLLLGLAIVEIGWAAMVATIPVLALHHGGASTAGWLLGAYGAGSVVGGLISSRAKRTNDVMMAWPLLGVAVASMVLLLPVPALIWALAIGAIGVGSGLFFPRFFSSVTTSTPPALRSRVLSTVHIVISMPGPIGFVAAGVMAQYSTYLSRLLIVAAASVGAGIVALAVRYASATTARVNDAAQVRVVV